MTSVRPQMLAGWTIATKEGKLAEPVEQHGETITEGVREITWSGGRVPDAYIQELALMTPGRGRRRGARRGGR